MVYSNLGLQHYDVAFTMDSLDETTVSIVDSALGCSVALSSPALSRLPCDDTHTADTLIPISSAPVGIAEHRDGLTRLPCGSETVDEGAESRDGFSSGPERRGGLTLSDGCARLRTKTKLTTKSTVKLELADSQNLPGRLDEYGKMQISEFPWFSDGFDECEGLSHNKTELCPHQISRWDQLITRSTSEDCDGCKLGGSSDPDARSTSYCGTVSYPRTADCLQDMKNNYLSWVQRWSQPHNDRTGEFEKSAISRSLVYSNSTTRKKKRAPRMPRHQRTSFSSQQKFRRERKGLDYNAASTPARQLEKMLKKKSEYDG